MRRIASIGLACMLATGARATEYFVDCSRPDDSGDGLTVASAKRTIQAAVNAAPADSVITVLPGVYDEGYTYEYNMGAGSRVILRKRLVLRSRDGAEKTIIVGARDPNGTDGMSAPGSNPVSARPVSVMTGGAGSVISNFTLTGGSSIYQSGQSSPRFSGGGVCAENVTGANPAWQTFVVGCIISNNVAMCGGGASRVTLVRCRLVDNHAANGAAAWYGHAAHCLFDGNRGGHTVHYFDTAVNCTFIDNQQRAMANQGAYLNCVFLLNGDLEVGNSTYATNCLTAKKDAHFTDCTVASNVYQMAAPVCGDYRLLSTSAGADIGRTADFGGLTMFKEGQLWTDLDGEPLARSGNVRPGCFQTLVTPQGGRLDFHDAGRNSVCGRVRTVASQYAYASEWPSQIRITPVLGTGEHLFGYQIRGGTYGRFRTVGPDGTLLMTMPPEGTTLSIQVLTGTAVYADPYGGDDTYAGDDLGSEEHPFETLQAAANSFADNTYGVVYAARGVYAKGGAYQDNASNRVAVAAKKYVRLVSLEGPENTIIVGAADPNGANGCGAAAMRCLTAKDYCFIQGFTLTGGHGAVGDSGNRGAGCFVGGSGMSDYVRITDCIISNNVAAIGAAAYGGVLERCRIFSNTNTSSGSLAGGRVVSSVMAGNSGYVFGLSEKSYFCTVAGNYGNVFRYASTHCGTIFIDCSSSSTYGSPSFTGCMAWGCTGFPESAELACEDPCLVGNGDLRPLSLSPAIAGFGATYPEDWWVWMTSDIRCNQTYFDGGKATLGAHQTAPLAVVVSGRDISPAGTNAVEAGASLAVSATAAGKELEGFVVDGVLRPVGEGVRSIAIKNELPVATGFVSVSAKYKPTGLVLLFK